MRGMQTRKRSQLASARTSLALGMLMLLVACKPSTPSVNAPVDREAVEAARKALMAKHPELLPKAQPSVPTTEAGRKKAEIDLLALYERLDAKLANSNAATSWSPSTETDMAILNAARDAQIDKTGCTPR